MTLTQQNIQDIGAIVAANIKQLVPTMVREIIQETAPPMIREVIQETVPPMVRQIVREETAELHQNVELIRQVQTHQGIALRTLQKDASQTKETVRHLGFMQEKMSNDIIALAGVVSDNLKVEKQVKDHEVRIGQTETTQKLLVATVSDHSDQLKTQSSSWYTRGHGRSSKKSK